VNSALSRLWLYGGKVIACVRNERTASEIVYLVEGKHMPRLRLLLAPTILMICASGSPAALFAQQSTPAPTRLALEVTFYPGRKPAYETVPGPESQPSGAWFGLFAHIASWQAPAGAPQVEAVRVVSRVEGDAVRVTVSTLSGTKALENEQRVGTYLIRETEKISIDELRLSGIEPFEIKLVRVSPNIAPVPPVILKGVESVVVINAMAKETTLPSYRIILRNQSNKNIVALGVDVVAGDKVQITSKPRGIDGQPLIPSGKEYWLTVAAPNRAQGTPHDYLPTTPSDQQIQIKAAVFEDGTYEGDAETAAVVKGYQAGEKMELARLIPLLENALNASDVDLVQGLSNLELQVSSVFSDADPGIIRNLAAEFPQLGRPVSQTIKSTMEFTATTIKSNLLKDIHKMQGEESQRVDIKIYRLWLTGMKDRYAKWLSRL
jgi:hypothetical protein